MATHFRGPWPPGVPLGRSPWLNAREKPRRALWGFWLREFGHQAYGRLVAEVQSGTASWLPDQGSLDAVCSLVGCTNADLLAGELKSDFAGIEAGALVLQIAPRKDVHGATREDRRFWFLIPVDRPAGRSAPPPPPPDDDDPIPPPKTRNRLPGKLPE